MIFNSNAQHSASRSRPGIILRGRIIIKLKDEGNSSSRLSIADHLDVISMLSGSRKFKTITPFHYSVQTVTRKPVKSVLEGIFKLTLNNPADQERIISWLNSLPGISYAEPLVNYFPLYVPDDPAAAVNGDQNYLGVIKAYNAWDLEKGDSSIVIGIPDTGLDLNHEDLGTNLFHNYADPLNGIDDDGDGYIDNYNGWDFADSDNDVSADEDPHGTEVTGITSATADNGKGMAGIAFHSEYLPLKIFRSSDNSFNNGYEAMLYAADHGCKVLVLSWGEAGEYSQFAQDIINYLVDEKDVVVIAAGGNTPENTYYYPASYDNVLSVGAVDINDLKTPWATYNDHIDIVAQGIGVYTTTNNGLYMNADGTSFSAPQVAAAAALLRTYRPGWTAKQVMEQLRVTADNIYSIPGNSQYRELLGKGRLNIFTALSDTFQPSVRMDDFNYNNGIAKYIFSEDTIVLTGDFTNYLAPVSNVKITLQSESPYAYVMDSTFAAGYLTTLQSFQNGIPYSIRFDPSLPPDSAVKLRLSITGNGYDDYQYINLHSTPSYFEFGNGVLSLTVANNGSLGYYKDSLLAGDGMNLSARHLLDRAGFFVTSKGREFSDNITEDLQYNINSKDFKPASPIRFYRNSVANLDARSTFKEINNLDSPVNVSIDQKILGWNGAESDSLLILEYRITNLNSDTLFNLNSGLFADWNLNDSTENKTGWISMDSLAFTKDNVRQLFAGISVLTGQVPGYYGVDIGSFHGNSSQFNYFSDSVKYSIIFGNVNKADAGINGAGNDVGQLTWAKTDTLLPNETVKIAFAIVVSSDSANLVQKRHHAKDLYREYINMPPLDLREPVCPGDSLIIKAGTGQEFIIFGDPLGASILKQDSIITIHDIIEDTTIYFSKIANGIQSDIGRMLIYIDAHAPLINTASDTIIQYNLQPAGLTLSDQSLNATSWDWDFGNGYGSNLRSAIAYYSQPGIYLVKLTSQSLTGCFDSAFMEIHVLESSPAPEVNDTVICEGNLFMINPSNVTRFRIYRDSLKSDLAFEGVTFTTTPLLRDTSFYLTGADSLFESLIVKLSVSVPDPYPEISWHPDTTDLLNKYSIDLSGSGNEINFYSWLINNTDYGRNKDTVFNYENLPEINIRLMVKNSAGCVDSTRLDILPVKSPDPMLVRRYLCRGDSVNIDPVDANYIMIYDDSTGKNLIGKGTQIKRPSLLRDSIFYIASVDSLLESRLVPVSLVVSEPLPDFSISPDTLNLMEGNKVNFIDRSQGALKREWKFQQNGTDTAAITFRYYYDPGRYLVELHLSDSLGCYSDTSRYLVVVSVNSYESGNDPETILFPNPAGNEIRMKGLSENGSYDIMLLTIAGNLVVKRKVSPENGVIIINLDGISPGNYILNVVNSKNNLIKKVIIK